MDYMEALRSHGERLATLEEQNRSAEYLRTGLQADVADLKVGQTRVETKLDMALGNGKTKLRKTGEGVGILGIGGTAIAAIIVAVLKGLEWVN